MLPNQPGGQVPIPGPNFGPDPGQMRGRRGIGLGAPNPLAQAIASLRAHLGQQQGGGIHYFGPGGAGDIGGGGQDIGQAIQALRGPHHPAHTYQDPMDASQGGPQHGHPEDFAAILEHLRSLTSVNPDHVALLKQLLAHRFGS